MPHKMKITTRFVHCFIKLSKATHQVSQNEDLDDSRNKTINIAVSNVYHNIRALKHQIVRGLSLRQSVIPVLKEASASVQPILHFLDSFLYSRNVLVEGGPLLSC